MFAISLVRNTQVYLTRRLVWCAGMVNISEGLKGKNKLFSHNEMEYYLKFEMVIIISLYNMKNKTIKNINDLSAITK